MSGAISISDEAKYTAGAERYPADMRINKQTDYIRFQFYEYEPPFMANQGAGGGFMDVKKTKDYYHSKSGNQGNIGKKAGSDVLLYMPQDVSTSMSTTWGGKEITNLASTTLSTYAQATDGRGKEALQALQTGIRNQTSGLPGTAAGELVRLGLAATGAQTNLGMNDILGGTAGNILNPNTEVLFGGPSIRNIGFKFKMAARDIREARTMLRICRRFQYHAAAKYGGTSPITKKIVQGLEQIGKLSQKGEKLNTMNEQDVKNWSESNNFISVPDLCLFKYMTGDKVNTNLNQYKACAITNVDVNFTPDGSYSTVYDKESDRAYPTAVELGITLVETKIIYQDQISFDPDEETN